LGAQVAGWKIHDNMNDLIRVLRERLFLFLKIKRFWIALKRLIGLDQDEVIDDIIELVKPHVEQIEFVIESKTIKNHSGQPPNKHAARPIIEYIDRIA
jgi:hypothetical protein